MSNFETESLEDGADELLMDRLRRDIIMGVHKPGQRLRFIDLRARYDIGSSPLREALSRLAAERMVVQELNRGFRVPTITPEELRDIVAMRRSLEPAAGRSAVEMGDDAWEEALLLAHRRLKRLGPAEDIVSVDSSFEAIETWEANHRNFHSTLIAACGSEWTRLFCAMLNNQFDRYRRLIRPPRDTQAMLGRQHDDMLAAALDRDAAAVADLLDSHVEITGRAVLDGLLAQD